MEQATFLNSGKNPIEGSSEKVQDKNWGKSAASFCHQVAESFPDMLHNFYLVKNHKIAKNSTTAKGREKISTYL
jgi:hypothetical protein